MSQAQNKPLALLVARSSNSLKLVSRQLEPHFKVMTASDAESAWDALLEFCSITLLISELELVIDGFGLLERLRGASDSRLAATPLLLLVGEDDDDAARERAFLKGASDFVNLPFSSQELTARARLHASLYLQQAQDLAQDAQPVAAVNLLQQLSQQKYFDTRVLQELSFSQRHRSSLSLCKLRLDNVRAIVDEFDKATAVTAVRAVAKTIQQTLRREDTLCYLGNAEFYVLYPATNGIGATAAVNRVFKIVCGNRLKIAGKPVTVTLSGAIYSCIAGDDADPAAIYARLDAGLAQAQAAGGNRVVSTGHAAEGRVISIDRALRQIENGNTGDLTEHAAALLEAVLPLLEFADASLGLGYDHLGRDLRAAAQRGGTKK